MEIITKRTKSPGDIVSNAESQSNVREEVNRRTCKAGYTDSDGQPPLHYRGGNGKGCWYREVNKEKFDKNYDKIDWSK